MKNHKTNEIVNSIAENKRIRDYIMRLWCELESFFGSLQRRTGVHDDLGLGSNGKMERTFLELDMTHWLFQAQISIIGDKNITKFLDALLVN
jgi:hypothetical protein